MKIDMNDIIEKELGKDAVTEYFSATASDGKNTKGLFIISLLVDIFMNVC